MEDGSLCSLVLCLTEESAELLQPFRFGGTGGCVRGYLTESFSLLTIIIRIRIIDIIINITIRDHSLLRTDCGVTKHGKLR